SLEAHVGVAARRSPGEAHLHGAPPAVVRCRTNSPAIPAPSSTPTCAADPAPLSRTPRPPSADCHLLHGTVKHHVRHVLYLTPREPPPTWPPFVETSSSLRNAIADACRALPAASPAKLTFAYVPVDGDAGAAAPDEEESADIVVFPEAVRVRGVTARSFRERLVPYLERPPEEPSVAGAGQGAGMRALSRSFLVEKLPHECSNRGVPMVAALRHELRKRLVPSAVVWEVSHVGGHKYAANVIMHPTGDWYGNLTAADAYLLAQVAQEVKPAMAQGAPVLWDRWRGRMGLNIEEQHAAFETYGMAGGNGPQGVVIDEAAGEERPRTDEREVSINFAYPNGHVAAARA
ncbi:MAG: Sucrase/ferredoxin-like-domain-containing protein, partial [Olpidium bornovanus]